MRRIICKLIFLSYHFLSPVEKVYCAYCFTSRGTIEILKILVWTIKFHFNYRHRHSSRNHTLLNYHLQNSPFHASSPKPCKDHTSRFPALEVLCTSKREMKSSSSNLRKRNYHRFFHLVTSQLISSQPVHHNYKSKSKLRLKWKSQSRQGKDKWSSWRVHLHLLCLGRDPGIYYLTRLKLNSRGRSRGSGTYLKSRSHLRPPPHLNSNITTSDNYVNLNLIPTPTK